MATTIDEALEMLAGTGPEFGGGLSNHGPMAAEALFVLGRGERVLPWVEQYKRRLQDGPGLRNPIAPNQWREALGRMGRVADWAAFFERELAEAPWREVIARWAPLLAPGLVAAATHGVIRTGHAVRSLEGGETPLRVRELAQALAYWAARYMELPGRPSRQSGGLTPPEALRRIEPLPAPEPGERPRFITDWLRRLEGRPEFEGAVDLADVFGQDFMSQLTQAFAGVYLANAHTGHVIGFIHAVTGPRALRLLLPHLPVEAVPDVLRYGWQAAAGIYAAMGERPDAGPVQAPPDSLDDLIDQAVATGDEHAIKFSEACLGEYALNPQPVYLAAAKHAIGALRRG